MDDYEWKKTVWTVALLLIIVGGALAMVFMNDS
jgi:hypothetical protein